MSARFARNFAGVEEAEHNSPLRNEQFAMNKTQTTLAALGAIFTLVGPTFAQGGMMATTATDKQFLIQSAQGSVADYANGAAAVNRAQNPAVRQLGIWLMEDHDRLNISLFALSGVRGIMLPLTPSASDQSDLSTLTSRQGAEFDRAWLQQAIKTNKQDISDAQRELKATTDPEVTPLVRAYLSTEYGHLAAAQSIMDSMK